MTGNVITVKGRLWSPLNPIAAGAVPLLLSKGKDPRQRPQGNGKWWREPARQHSDGQESWALPAPPLLIAFSWNPVFLSRWSLGTLVLFAFPSWQLWSPGKGADLLIENTLHAWLSTLGKEMYMWKHSCLDPNVSLILFHSKAWPVFALCWLSGNELK